MKRFLLFIITALLMGLFVAPAFAQDATTPVNNTSLALTYGVVIVLAVLLVAAGIYGAHVTGYLAKLVPPETASSIYAAGVRFGFQVALNQAAQTPSTLDDEFFQEMARLRGLQVIKRPDGSYEVKQPGTPPPDPITGQPTA